MEYTLRCISAQLQVDDYVLEQAGLCARCWAHLCSGASSPHAEEQCAVLVHRQ